MSFEILPQEFQIREGGADIRTRVPREELTDAMILRRVIAANMTAGDRVTVQCMDHGYERVLHATEYLVSKWREYLDFVEDTPDHPRQVTKKDVTIARVADWWSASEKTVRYNPGKKVHQVLDGDEVVFEGAKDEAHEMAKRAA